MTLNFQFWQSYIEKVGIFCEPTFGLRQLACLKCVHSDFEAIWTVHLGIMTLSKSEAWGVKCDQNRGVGYILTHFSSLTWPLISTTRRTTFPHVLQRSASQNWARMAELVLIPQLFRQKWRNFSNIYLWQTDFRAEKKRILLRISVFHWKSVVLVLIYNKHQ